MGANSRGWPIWAGSQSGMPCRMTDSVTVSFPSTVDLQSAHYLRCGLLEAVQARPERLVVDMSAVESFDVTAGAVLVGVRRRLQHSGGTMQFINVSQNTRAMLRTIGLHRFLAA